MGACKPRRRATDWEGFRTAMPVSLFSLGLVLCAVGQAPVPPVQRPPAGEAAANTNPRRDEVVANIQAQTLGAGTVADLALPDDFLRRMADRILRQSFEERFRIVVAGDAATAAAPTPTPTPTPESAGTLRRALDGLAIAAALVLAVLGYFAWKARGRRKE